jgi:RNA polymerase sigma-70 factor, ECF subfamily
MGMRLVTNDPEAASLPVLHNDASSLEGSAPEVAGPDEVDSALDRLLISEAMAQLCTEHRAVVRRSSLRALRLTLQEMGVTR